MTEQILFPFASPTRHAAIADIIRRRSTNGTDVREAALAGLDLGTTRQVLDLGCGFGFMTATIGERIAAGAHILGVDACEENRAAFLRVVHQAGRQGQFQCLRLAGSLPWPSHSFDLVLASYSLYYFAGVLPDIPRLLRPSGLFLAVTHSETTFQDLCRAAGLNDARCPLSALIRQFSAENGPAQLQAFFGKIEKIDYPNALQFGAPHEDDLLQYVQFKLPLLAPQTRLPAEVPEPLRRRLTDILRQDGSLRLDKNDAIFRCREPRMS